MILWGINEQSCARCMQNYEQDGKRAPCLDGGDCLTTKRPRTMLDWREYRLLEAALFVVTTGQLPVGIGADRDLALSLAAHARVLIEKRGARSG